jgi:hypothetical protein
MSDDVNGSPETTRKPWYRPRNIVLAILGLIAATIAYAWWWQASLKPTISHDYQADLIALAAAGQPEGENGWPHVERACEAAWDLRWGRAEEPFNLQFDFAALLRSESASADEARVGDARADAPATEADIMRAIKALDGCGAFDALTRAMACPRHVKTEFQHDDDLPGYEETLLGVLVPEVQSLRMLREVTLARMCLHARHGQTEAMLDDLQRALFIDEVLIQQPFMMHTMAGSRGAISTLNAVRQLVTHEPQDPETLGRFDDMIRRFPTTGHVESAIESERFVMLDLVQHLFTDDGEGDGMLIMSKYNEIASPMASVNDPTAEFTIDLPLGNYAGLLLAGRRETVKFLDGYFDRWRRRARMSRDERLGSAEDSSPLVGNLPPRLAHTAIMFPVSERILETTDRLQSEVAGTRIMLAIERHRLGRGPHPTTLDDLVPDFLAELPADPYSADGIRYRAMSNPNPGDLPYALFSVGPDGEPDTDDDLKFTLPPKGAPSP